MYLTDPDQGYFTTELTLEYHSGQAPILGSPEYDYLRDTIYGAGNMGQLVFYIDDHLLSPDRELSVPASTLVLPERKLDKLDRSPEDFPMTEEVAVVSEEFATELFW
jgi:hypothetical protein